MSDPKPPISIDYERRFAGTKKLYGSHVFSKFEQAHVFIAGIGGVGTWVVEALARTGIGQFTLVDMDVLAESNINRQLPAMTNTLGEDKAQAMANRITGINPTAKINIIDDFVSQQNANELLSNAQPHIILDCVDDVPAKIAMALYARFNKVPIIMAGGAGGKIDPSRIQTSDLRKTEQDPLLAKVRNKLRHECNINKSMKENFGITCVYSDEPPIVDKSCDAGAGLHCGGYGSAVTITNTVAMHMVAQCLKKIEKRVKLA